jgi:hypothetical protein
MNKTFIEKVRGGEIKSPTQRGFDIQKWNKEWEKTKNKEDIKSENLYKMGKIIDSVLSELRNKLEHLYKINEIDNIDNEKMMMAFFALSNRDRLIINEKLNEIGSGSSVFNITISTVTGNKLTLEEASINSVDSLEKAILFCKDRLNKEKDLKGKINNLPSIELPIINGIKLRKKVL